MLSRFCLSVVSNSFRILLAAASCLVLLGQAAPAFAAPAADAAVHYDALVLPEEVLARRLTAMQASEGIGAAQASNAPGYYDTSVYMIGTVAVGLILPESNGKLDANAENWTSTEKAKVKREIMATLAWYESQAPAGAHLRFVLDSAAPRVVPTKYEPINRRQSQEGLWIGDTLSNMGYSEGDYFARTYAYVNALRAQYQTDWALVIYVVDSSKDRDGYFADGYFSGYSYLGGPFMVMTYDNGNWGIDAMNEAAAHEMGHIFLAGDQYTGSRCTKTQRFGYLGVLNSWCADSHRSVMKGDYVLLSGDPARGQLGWRDTDRDGIPDPVDVRPTVTLPAHVPDPTSEISFAYLGLVKARPYKHATCSPYYYCWTRDVTLLTVSEMMFQVDGGAWQTLLPLDGAFDGQSEEFGFPVGPFDNGLHTIVVRGTTSFSRTDGAPVNLSNSASDSVTIEAMQ